MAKFIDSEKITYPTFATFYDKENKASYVDDCASKKAIEQIPPADVVPVIHAKYENPDELGNYQCSNCGDKVGDFIVDEFKYCPNCGAKMDKE